MVNSRGQKILQTNFWKKIHFYYISYFSATLLVASINGKLPCQDQDGVAHRCAPNFENAAFRRELEVSNTCGLDRPEKYYRQTGRRSSSGTPRFICDDLQQKLSHPPGYLTDEEDKDTWWQSQSMWDSRKMGDGIQHPNNVTLMLDLHKVTECFQIKSKMKSKIKSKM